jgi:hypothetical protein
LQDAARGIASISREAGLEVDEEEYLGSFRPSLMDVFYSWSKGKSFAEVMTLFICCCITNMTAVVVTMGLLCSVQNSSAQQNLGGSVSVVRSQTHIQNVCLMLYLLGAVWYPAECLAGFSVQAHFLVEYDLQLI